MAVDDTLFIIPARGGSKGLPRKNILPLVGKPLIIYSIEAARGITDDENICVSSDDQEIIEVVENYGIKVPFVRPSKFSSDTAGSHEVILHAINYYRDRLGKYYTKVCLLQPTSPMRTSNHILEAFNIWKEGLDMVVSVQESKANPYFNLFEETTKEYLKKAKAGNFTRRQDAPKVWEFNGAIYIININSIETSLISQFTRIKKYVMSEIDSIDIDNEFDWTLAEFIMSKKMNLNENNSNNT